MVLGDATAPTALVEQIGKNDIFRLFEPLATVILALGRFVTLEHVQLLQIARAEKAAHLLLVEDALGKALFLNLSSVHFLLHCALGHQSWKIN